VSWTHIQGHDRWVKMFADVVRNRRLGHAYLFLGPEGVGKRTFAQELATTLLCEERGETFEACGRCPACVLMAAGTHPDFFAIERWSGKGEMPKVNKEDDGYVWQGNVGIWVKKESPIDLMRDLCNRFTMKPARGHGKVIIIDDADDVNEESANCFLKTLEEPPPGSAIFMVGTSPDRQKDTILSRCQLIRFAPLHENAVRDALVKQGVAADLLPRLLRLANGSPGQALALVEPELWQFRQVLLNGLAAPQPDTVALAKEWAKFAESAGKETAAHRRRAVAILRLLQAFLGDALALSSGGQRRIHDVQDRNLLLQLCERAGPEKILAWLERTLETEKHLDRYIQVSLVLETLLVGGDW
jgi:DNA polymerase III subunit delta'